MKKLIYFATLFLSLWSFASNAQSGRNASYYLDATLFPVWVDRNDTRSISAGATEVGTESGLGYDARFTAGYLLGHDYLIGLTYNMYSLKTKRDAVSGGDSGLEETTEHNEWGPTVGWLPGNWRFLFTMFMGGKKTVHSINSDDSGTTGDVTITNTGVGGFQFVGGYTFQIGSNFGAGPSLVYRSLSFDKQSKVNALNGSENYDDMSLSSKAIEGTLSAMFTMVFTF